MEVIYFNLRLLKISGEVNEKLKGKIYCCLLIEGEAKNCFDL